MRLDIISAILTVYSMTEVGRKRWQGWALAFANSVVVCILAVHVAPKQWALIPPNVLCLFLYARNLWTWKYAKDGQSMKTGGGQVFGLVCCAKLSRLRQFLTSATVASRIAPPPIARVVATAIPSQVSTRPLL